MKVGVKFANLIMDHGVMFMTKFHVKITYIH